MIGCERNFSQRGLVIDHHNEEREGGEGMVRDGEGWCEETRAKKINRKGTAKESTARMT